MKILILFVWIAVGVKGDLIQIEKLIPKEEALEQFKQFINKYGRNYGSNVIETLRFGIFHDNLDKITKHNKEADTGVHSYRLGVNNFTDLTNAEFVKLYNTLRDSNEMNDHKNDSIQSRSDFVMARDDSLPSQVDWRNKHVVTRVKNQGQCGSCWAFSAVAAIEGQYAKKKHALVSFSEQNLVDCDGKDYGCNGGWPANAFEYTLNGINRESVYPYRGRQQTCQYNSKKLGTKVNNWHYVIPTEDENAVQKAVAKIGPVSAVIDAGRYSFQFYSSGVYDEPSCSSTVHNHAIAIVGYGKLNGKDYWIVKNSWGTSWGQQGYILMSRNKNNQCGIAYRVAYPLI